MASTSENVEAECVELELTEAQKRKIEENRLKALEKRKRKLVPHPYAKSNEVNIEKHVIKVAGTKVIDSGGGFLIEENNADFTDDIPYEFFQEPVVNFCMEKPKCEECNQEFQTSYLLETFEYPVCNNCRDKDEKHSLITKTDAKKEYLLQDCDIDKREPILKYIVRKNPHNVRWGEMKLYLRTQIEKRALEVWGSEEILQEEIEKREEKRVELKTKKYQKELKQLKMNMRSSLYDKTSAASHAHEFGPESYNEEDDEYMHTCLTCGYKESFEKM